MLFSFLFGTLAIASGLLCPLLISLVQERHSCVECGPSEGPGHTAHKGRLRELPLVMRVVRHWSRLPTEAMDAPSLEVFKIRLAGALSNLI